MASNPLLGHFCMVFVIQRIRMVAVRGRNESLVLAHIYGIRLLDDYNCDSVFSFCLSAI